MLATMLELDGTQVVVASNGADALELARRHKPGLILLDLMMPRMSGEEFRQAQLAAADIRHIPVVVISARHDIETIADRMHVAAFMRKPLDLDALLQLVHASGV